MNHVQNKYCRFQKIHRSIMEVIREGETWCGRTKYALFSQILQFVKLGSQSVLPDHEIGLRVLVSALLYTLAQGVGEGKCANAPDVHVEGQNRFSRNGELVEDASGKSAGRECGGGLKNNVFKRNHWLDSGDDNRGYHNDYQRHGKDGVGFVHQIEWDGLLVELDSFFTAYGGKKGLDDDEEGGGFDAAAS